MDDSLGYNTSWESAILNDDVPVRGSPAPITSNPE